MARPTSRKKSRAGFGVTLLRQSLNETMEVFAQRMGVSLNTVSRWENSLPPRGKTLKRLYQLAKRSNSKLSEKAFMRALEEEGNEAYPQIRAAEIMSPENIKRMREAFRILWEVARDAGELDMPGKAREAAETLADLLFIGGRTEFLKDIGEI